MSQAVSRVASALKITELILDVIENRLTTITEAQKLIANWRRGELTDQDLALMASVTADKSREVADRLRRTNTLEGHSQEPPNH